MSDRNESYGNPSANYLMQRVWDAEHPPKGSMTTGDPRITVHTSPVSHVCKALRAVTEERDALQARIAQLEQSALTGYEDGWHALRNERDALKAENAQLRDVLADRDMDREMAARSKLELIEANRQLEALRARIEDAPIAWWDPEEGPLSVSSLFNRQLTDGCKRVALVPLGDDE